MTLPAATTDDTSGIWMAPGRVNLIGEHTDYNDGFVLPFALPQRTQVHAQLLPGPKRWVLSSAFQDGAVTFTPEDLKPGAIEGWAAYVAGIVGVLTDAGYDVPAAQFTITSDVPVGAGLSSSAALECAVLIALCDLGGLDVPLTERPKLAQRAENVYAGVPCGVMDQSASTLCLPGHALFLDCRSHETEHIPFDLAAHGLTMLVIDTRAPHQHVDNEYALRRSTCEEAAAALGIRALRDVTDLASAMRMLPSPVMRRRARHIVTENERVRDTVALLRDNRVAEIGPLLTASHASMRDDYEITVPEVDTAVEAALEAGAIGARMTGGGFGGCVLALTETAAIDQVADAVTKAFADSGFTAPNWFTAVAGGGASRVA